VAGAAAITLHMPWVETVLACAQHGLRHNESTAEETGQEEGVTELRELHAHEA